MTNRRNIASMLADPFDNSVSSKRVVTLLSTFLVMLAFLMNLFLGKTVDEFMFDGMMFIVLGGFGSTTVEKFALTKKSRDSEYQQDP